MRLLVISIVLGSACLAAAGARAQTAESFQSGWFIVEKPARFAVLVPTAGDVRSQSQAAKAGSAYTMQIGVGEVVVAFAKQGDLTFCYEASGRVSAIRGRGALTPAPAGGTPALVTKDVESGGRTLRQASSVWVVATAADGQHASVQLDGGTTLELESASLRFLSNVLTDATADKEWVRAK